MNKIKYLLIVLIAAFIYSCAEDDFENPPAPANFNNVAQVVVDGVDNDPAVLLKLNESEPWDTLIWTAAQLYEGEGLVTHYTVQIDEQGNNFASAMNFQSSTTSDTSIVITEGTLNSRLIANGYSPVQTYDLELRVKAFVHEQLDSLYSDVIPFTVTTYLDVPIAESMYIYGDATMVGWEASDALLMYSDGGVHTGFTYLENNMKFRFLKQRDESDNTYNSSSLITYSDNVSKANDEMMNFLFTGTSGWYKIEANYLTSELTIAEHTAGAATYTYDYPNLYLVGDYNSTDGVWDAQNAVPFTKDGEGLYSITTALKDGAQFKFIGQQDWGDLEWANLGESGNSGSLGPNGFNGNITFDGGGDSYKITVDLKKGVYSIKSTQLYMIGDGVGDWSWDNTDLQMIQVNSHSNLYWKIVWMNATGGFKFAPEKAWGNDFGSDSETVSDEYNFGGSNVPVPGTEGYYMVVVDMATSKISVVAPEVYLMGNTVGSWDTANPDAKFTVDNANEVLTITKDLAADEIRMYAWHSYFTDWWQSEFIILDGQIVFRGTGPDQERVNVTAGTHTVELNFKTGEGSISSK